jgi:TrmH family RNA methyltransferase
MITSSQNEKVKLAYALQSQPKVRRSQRKLALEGTRLVRDAQERGRKPEFVLFDPAAADMKLIKALQRAIGEAKVLPVAPEVLKHVSTTDQPQGIVAVLPMPMPDLPRQPRRVLVLDGVRDPGNMGTVLRTAAAAGAQVALLSPDCVDPYNPKVLRGGMGAHFRLPIVEASWVDIARYCEGVTIYLAAGEAEQDYATVDWTQPWALIIGSEAHGASADARALATAPVSIPMAADTESINAGVAAGVILFEAARQRRMKG